MRLKWKNAESMLLGFSWILLNCPEFSWNPPKLSPEFSWIFLNSPEFSWIFLNSPEFSWILLNFREFSWIFLNLPEFWWMALNSPEWPSISSLKHQTQPTTKKSSTIQNTKTTHHKKHQPTKQQQQQEPTPNFRNSVAYKLGPYGILSYSSNNCSQAGKKQALLRLALFPLSGYDHKFSCLISTHCVDLL